VDIEAQAAYKNYCIDHNQILQMIETLKYSLLMVQICPKQIQDGGRPPSLKIEKSQYLRNRLTVTKFCILMRLHPLDPNNQ